MFTYAQLQERTHGFTSFATQYHAGATDLLTETAMDRFDAVHLAANVQIVLLAAELMSRQYGTIYAVVHG